MASKPTIRTYLDIVNFPRYKESIDPKTKPLKRIIVPYSLKEEYPCGLEGCHTPHKDGYMVELEDGDVTNVGWICGKNFGEKFAYEKNRYAEQELRPKAISSIQIAKTKINSLSETLKKINEVAEHLSNCKAGIRNKFPSLYSELVRRAHNSDARVIEHVERAKEDFERLANLNPSVNREQFRYQEVGIGISPGLRIMAINIREELITNLTSVADVIVQTDLINIKTKKLLELENWANRLDETIQNANKIIADGNLFFSKDCYTLLSHITANPKEKKSIVKLTTNSLVSANAATTSADEQHVKLLGLSGKQRRIQKKLAAILKKN